MKFDPNFNKVDLELDGQAFFCSKGPSRVSTGHFSGDEGKPEWKTNQKTKKQRI